MCKFCLGTREIKGLGVGEISVDGGLKRLSYQLKVARGNGGTTTFISKDVKIKYCPMCGDELDDRYE